MAVAGAGASVKSGWLGIVVEPPMDQWLPTQGGERAYIINVESRILRLVVENELVQYILYDVQCFDESVVTNEQTKSVALPSACT